MKKIILSLGVGLFLATSGFVCAGERPVTQYEHLAKLFRNTGNPAEEVAALENFTRYVESMNVDVSFAPEGRPSLFEVARAQRHFRIARFIASRDISLSAYDRKVAHYKNLYDLLQWGCEKDFFIEYMRQYNVDPNFIPNHNKLPYPTLLSAAVQYNRHGVVEFLLSCNADPNVCVIPEMGARQPLWRHALQFKQYEILTCLLQNGTRFEYGLEIDYATLFSAFECPDRTVFKELVRACTPAKLAKFLSEAISKNDVAFMELLLTYCPEGVVQTARAAYSAPTKSLVWHAACIQRTEILELLLAHGAAQHMTVMEVYELFWLVGVPRNSSLQSEQGKKAVIDMLRAHGLTDKIYDGGITIFHATEGFFAKDFNLIQFFCDHDIKEHINTPNAEGKTPLWLAVKRNDTGQVKVLLEHGAAQSVNVPDKAGTTPVALAKLQNNSAIANLLVLHSAGESFTAPDAQGRTPLWLAVKQNDAQQVKVLLEQGAAQSVNVPDTAGTTLLALAVLQDNSAIIDLLISHGAGESLTAPDGQGRTPLCIAVSNKNVALADMLLFYGGCKDIHNPEFTDMLFFEAIKNNDEPMVSLLASYGALITPTLLGKTAAARITQPSMYKLLNKIIKKQTAARRNEDSACVIS